MRPAVLVTVLAGCQVVFPLTSPPEDVDGSVDAAPLDANIVFITGMTHDGNFGGRAGADAQCSNAAGLGGFTGTFVAWVSVAGGNAIDRLAGSRGWMRPDHQPVADLPSELITTGPRVPLVLSEAGDIRSSPTLVWTGTGPTGTTMNPTCSDWSVNIGVNANMGDPTQGRSEFSAATSAGCGASHRLYCFGTGKVTQIPPGTPADKIWFTSDQTWVPSAGGIADADAICASEGASLPGTFRALLGTAAASAASRFTPGSHYVRPDGVSIGTLTQSLPDAFPNRTASGSLVNGDAFAWTGGVPPTMTSTVPTDTCADWTVAGASGASGGWNFADGRLYKVASTPCSNPHHLYCLQL